MNLTYKLHLSVTLLILTTLSIFQNCNGQSLGKRNRAEDKPDTILYVCSKDQLDSIAKKLDKRGIGYYYIWSRSYQLQTYGKGYGKTIWYIYKGKDEYENDNKLIVKKYTAII